MVRLEAAEGTLDRDAYLSRHRRSRLPRLSHLRLPPREGSPRRLRGQPRNRLAQQHQAHPRSLVSVRDVRHHEPLRHRRAGGLRLPHGLARIAHRLRAAAAPHAQGGRLRHAQRAGPGQEAPRPVPHLLHQRGLRRPARAPAARDVLGQRQPDRPARSVRRGQALRRGADDGLPAPAGRGHLHRPDLQHLRTADAPERRPRRAHLPSPGALRAAGHGLRRGDPDAELLLRPATWCGASWPSTSPTCTTR